VHEINSLQTKKWEQKMNKKLFIYLIILFPFLANAEITKYIAVGTTRASLRSEGGKSDWGSYLGLGVEYSKPNSILFAVEANYATKKVTLQNKSWQRDHDLFQSGISIGDIPIDGSYLELAAKIGGRISLANNHISIKVFVGTVISNQLKYLSGGRWNFQFDYDPDKGPYTFDYLRRDWADGGAIYAMIPFLGLSSHIRIWALNFVMHDHVRSGRRYEA
jgi:hypothetical protein